LRTSVSILSHKQVIFSQNDTQEISSDIFFGATGISEDIKHSRERYPRISNTAESDIRGHQTQQRAMSQDINLCTHLIATTPTSAEVMSQDIPSKNPAPNNI
jgi:hypothetical protein